MFIFDCNLLIANMVNRENSRRDARDIELSFRDSPIRSTVLILKFIYGFITYLVAVIFRRA